MEQEEEQEEEEVLVEEVVEEVAEEEEEELFRCLSLTEGQPKVFLWPLPMESSTISCHII